MKDFGGKKPTSPRGRLVKLEPLPPQPYVPKFDALEYAKQTGSFGFGSQHDKSLFSRPLGQAGKKKKKKKAPAKKKGRGRGGTKPSTSTTTKAAAAAPSSSTTTPPQSFSAASFLRKPLSAPSAASSSSSASKVFGAPLMERRDEVVGLSLRHIERGLQSKNPAIARSTLASLGRLHTMFASALSLHEKMTRDESPTMAALERQMRRHAAFRRIACAADAQVAAAGIAGAADGDDELAVYARRDPGHAREHVELITTLKKLARDGNARARALLERRF